MHFYSGEQRQCHAWHNNKIYASTVFHINHKWYDKIINDWDYENDNDGEYGKDEKEEEEKQ